MKKLGLFVFGMLIISMSLGFVSASPADAFIKGIQDAGKVVFEISKPILETVIGETVNGETFLAKLLFLIIIFAIVWMAVGKIDFFSDNTWAMWIVSVAVSILAIRWFGNAQIINTVVLPYSALGIAISAGIPFVLAFLIIGGLNGTLRKFAWIFFAIIFVGLWFSRYDELGSFGYIYLVTAGLSIVMMIMDGTIQKWRTKMKLDKVGYVKKSSAIDNYKKKIVELTGLVTDGIISQSEADKRKKGYVKHLAWLSK